MNSTKNNTLLSEKELECIILIAIPESGATEEQILGTIRECETMKINALILETILTGKVEVKGYSGTAPLWGKKIQKQ